MHSHRTVFHALLAGWWEFTVLNTVFEFTMVNTVFEFTILNTVGEFAVGT